jgi:hypothetical protein
MTLEAGTSVRQSVGSIVKYDNILNCEVEAYSVICIPSIVNIKLLCQVSFHSLYLIYVKRNNNTYQFFS